MGNYSNFPQSFWFSCSSKFFELKKSFFYGSFALLLSKKILAAKIVELMKMFIVGKSLQISAEKYPEFLRFKVQKLKSLLFLAFFLLFCFSNLLFNYKFNWCQFAEHIM